MRGAFSTRSKLAITCAAFCVMALMMTGANAAIAGSVTGTVTITSPAAGITTSCAPTQYSFSGVTINGTLTSGSAVFTGSVSVSGVHGGSSGPHPFAGTAVPNCPVGLENSEGASGNVNTAAVPATFTGNSFPPGNIVNGRFWGEPADATCGGPCGYIRRGTVVTVKLHVQFCINMTFAACFPGGVPSGSTASTIVSVNAQFTPVAINTSTAGVTGAVFQGSFNG